MHYHIAHYLVILCVTFVSDKELFGAKMIIHLRTPYAVLSIECLMGLESIGKLILNEF